jgi:hypothetical protein
MGRTGGRSYELTLSAGSPQLGTPHLVEAWSQGGVKLDAGALQWQGPSR